MSNDSTLLRLVLKLQSMFTVAEWCMVLGEQDIEPRARFSYSCIKIKILIQSYVCHSYLSSCKKPGMYLTLLTEQHDDG